MVMKNGKKAIHCHRASEHIVNVLRNGTIVNGRKIVRTKRLKEQQKEKEMKMKNKRDCDSVTYFVTTFITVAVLLLMVIFTIGFLYSAWQAFVFLAGINTKTILIGVGLISMFAAAVITFVET